MSFQSLTFRTLASQLSFQAFLAQNVHSATVTVAAVHAEFGKGASCDFVVQPRLRATGLAPVVPLEKFGYRHDKCSDFFIEKNLKLQIFEINVDNSIKAITIAKQHVSRRDHTSP